MNRDFSSSLEN